MWWECRSRVIVSDDNVKGETSQIVMIPYVKNGGYTKEEGIGDWRQVVGSDVGFRQQWQQQGHRYLYSHHLGVILHVHGRVTDA